MFMIITVTYLTMQAKQHGFVGIHVFAYWLVPLTNTTEDIIATEIAQRFFLGLMSYEPIIDKLPSTCIELPPFPCDPCLTN